MPVAPFLAILTFAAVAHFRRLPAIVLAIAGVQICVHALLWNDPHLMWNNGIGSSALLKFLDRGSGRLSAYVPSIFTPVSGRTLAIIAATSIGWLILTAWLSRRERGLPLRRPA